MREEAEEDERDNPINSLEELLAMVNRARAGGHVRPDRRDNGGPRKPAAQRGDNDRQRPPRKCPNCGKEHEAGTRVCPHPSVQVTDRPCWTCGKKGHTSQACPDRKAKGTIKAIEDIIPFFGACVVAEADEGFTIAKKTARPTPQTAQLGDFLATTTRNRFNIIRDEAPATTTTNNTTRSQPVSSRTKVGIQPARNQPDKIIIRSKKQESNLKKTVKATTEKSNRSVAAWDSTPMSCQAKPEGEDAIISQLSSIEEAVIAAISEYRSVSSRGKGEPMPMLGGPVGSPIGLPRKVENSINLIFDDDDEDEDEALRVEEEVIAVADEKVRVGVAVDSGATANVIGLDDLPKGCVPEGPVGAPFSNASGGDIKKYGKVKTLMTSADGQVGCGWTAAAVTRPLHSVSTIAGPEDGPGLQDVMFDNTIGVVMPPGLVKLLLKHIRPIARYPRRGGLYVGDFEMSSFTRQGQGR